MNYREEMEVSKKYKEEYLEGFNYIIKERQKMAEAIRKESVKDIFSNQEKYREDFKKMLGWPLVDHETNGLPEVISEKLSEEDGYTVYRMHFEILEGLKLTGLFFKADGEEKKPLVIAQHGGAGTPENISGAYGKIEGDNYNDMLHRIRKNDVHVFAPQLLIWGGNFDVTYNRQAVDARLKRVGSSVTAVEIYGIIRILDYFEAQKYVSAFGMVGLSYGGFYTLYTAAIDTRIKSAISCSWFNKRDAYPQSDWTWFKSAEQFDDAEIACLIYPRSLCIEIGDHDPLFDYTHGEESFEDIKKLCKNVGTDWVEFIVFDGNHEFCKDDEPIHKLVNTLKNSDIKNN